MSTDSNAKIRKVLRSFSFAVQGIAIALKKETNLKIHFTVTFIVIILGFLVSLSLTEWLFILFAIGGVISFELLNTAIERGVDLVTKEYHPLAKQAKDIAAGAVLVYTIVAVLVGMIIFVPKLMIILS
jgi:undecaprenol kinase